MSAATPSGGDTRVALITGAAAGIGRAYAERLAAEGMLVLALDREEAGETLERIAAAGGTAEALRCDLTDPASVAAAAASALERHGAVDILVHNAGIYPFEAFEQITPASWRRVMAVNLDALLLLTQPLLPAMRERGWGRIVAMTSTAFDLGTPGFVHYVASKGGVIGFVRSLATEVAGDGITVNAIAPSLVRTKGTAEGPHEELGLFELVTAGQAIERVQVPADLVGALAFLVSEEAGFITGQTLAVDGGSVRR